MELKILHEICIQLQVSAPIQILSILSIISTALVIIVVVYLIRKEDSHTMEPIQPRIPENIEEFFLLTKEWEFEKHKTLLSSFLLTDEYTILNLLITSLKEDGISVADEGDHLNLSGEGGWRNKHQISEGTGLSSRKIYDKNGIIERLANLGFLEIRDKDGWGSQTNQYRANINHALVKSVYAALLQS